MAHTLQHQELDENVDWLAKFRNLCRLKLKAGSTTIALLTELREVGEGPAFKRVSNRAIRLTDPVGVWKVLTTFLPALVREGVRLDAAGYEAEAIEVAYLFEQIVEALGLPFQWMEPVGSAPDFLAAFAAKRGDFARAVLYHDLAIKLNPDYPGFQLNKAETLRRNGQSREHIALLVDVAERWPDNVVARARASEMFNLFVAFNTNEGQMPLGRAVEGFDAALTFNPNNMLALHNRVYALRDLGQLTKADIDQVAHLFVGLDLSGPGAYRPRT